MPNITIPNPNVLLTDNSWYTYEYGLYQFVRANRQLRLGGILINSIQQESNNGSSPTNIVDYIFQPNQLKTNNDVLNYSFKGTYTANSNNKQIVLTFGSQTIFDTTALAVNGGAWIFEVEVTRTAAATQNIFVKAFYDNLSKTAFIAGTQDSSDNIEIKLTATGVSNGDITLQGYCFTLNPVD